MNTRGEASRERTAGRATVLLCTLGQSWAVVPEIYGFLAPARLDLYRHHPEASALAATRERHGLEEPSEVWILTTASPRLDEGVRRLGAWWRWIGAPTPLRAWRAADTDNLAGEAECLRYRELVFRAVLAAGEHFDRVVVSLAGGRKTMSADLQWAARVFGAHAVLHVLDRAPLPDELRDPPPERMAAPLDRELAKVLMPLVVLGPGPRLESLDVETEHSRPVSSATHPLPVGADLFGESIEPTVWEATAGPALVEEVLTRERDSHRLLANFVSTVLERTTHSPWSGLLRLPPAVIRRLEDSIVSEGDVEWLRRVPKAELHLHLGGSLDLAAQRAVGRAVWEALDRRTRETARHEVGDWLEQGRWPADWPQRLRRSSDRTAAAAALLAESDPHDLERHLWPRNIERFGLKHRHPLKFSAYELPGELTGSAILGHPAAVEEYARQLVAILARHGVIYAEVRGSPTKYLGGDGMAFLRGFHRALSRCGDEVDVRFLVVVDRRGTLEDAKRAVHLAVEAHRELEGFVVGVDLAGDEARRAAGELAPAFAQAFEACLRVTIHAGEGEPPSSIWEAAYSLHADRIGHGLSLAEHEALAQRFRDREICLELCPTSNLEVVGFYDPGRPEATCDLPRYPLRRLLQLGLPLTICTDNPGISRTDPAREYVTASRLVDGLTKWEALGLVRQGFEHAFCSAAERARWMQRADAAIRTLLLGEVSP